MIKNTGNNLDGRGGRKGEDGNEGWEEEGEGKKGGGRESIY